VSARSGNFEERLNHSRFAQIVHQEIAFGINVGCNVMGDLPRIVAQAHPAVERNRADLRLWAANRYRIVLSRAKVAPACRRVLFPE
jgi:hypothetical protein